MRVILASGSVRRRKWLESQEWLHNHDFEVMPLNLVESDHVSPGDVLGTVNNVARAKAETARHAFGGNASDWLILVSDTLVENPKTGGIMGKPRGREEAERMLSSLSGRSHKVHTCTVLIASDMSEYEAYSESAVVSMACLKKGELSSLINGESWIGKAGSYDIMGPAGKYMRLMSGSVLTVSGLAESAVERLKEILSRK